MANIWTGAAQSVPQVDSVTPANIGIGNVYTVTVNGKSASFTATDAVVATVTAGLAAAIEASEEPELAELTATDNTTNVLVTGPDDGTPFTLTASATGGTAMNTRAAVTAASGPNHWDVPENWSLGVVPDSLDDVIIDGPTPDILYGLDQSVVTLASLLVTASYTGTIGLPERDPAGYTEYRPTYLAIGSTLTTIGTGSGPGSGRLKIDTGSGGTTLNVQSTGAGIETGTEAVLWKGTGTTNVNVMTGSVGLAVLPNDTATAATLRVGGGTGGAEAQVRGGSLLTLATLNQSGGTVELNAGVTTVTKVAGTLAITGTGAVTTLNNDGGDLFYQSSGTITTLRTSKDGVTDFSRDPRARTVTNCQLDAGGSLLDPARTVTWTNPIVLNRCSIRDVTIDVGTHCQIQVTAGP